MQDKLIARAKELLSEGKVKKVVGWKKGLFEDDITPAVFTTAEELDKDFVFNKYCKANLSKYLVGITKNIEIAKSTTRMNNTMAKQRDPNAQDAPIPQEVVLVFLKPADTLIDEFYDIAEKGDPENEEFCQVFLSEYDKIYDSVSYHPPSHRRRLL